MPSVPRDESNVERLYLELRDRAMRYEFKPGARINEKQLGEQLGVVIAFERQRVEWHPEFGLGPQHPADRHAEGVGLEDGQHEGPQLHHAGAGPRPFLLGGGRRLARPLLDHRPARAPCRRQAARPMSVRAS